MPQGKKISLPKKPELGGKKDIINILERIRVGVGTAFFGSFSLGYGGAM
jgi:hypothetical protein